MKTICICGGGAIGHVVAAVLGAKQECQVHILTGRPNKWQTTVTAVDRQGKKYTAPIAKISNNPADVIPLCDAVLLCLPGYMIEKTLRDIAPLVADIPVGSVVCSTGFFQMANKLLPSTTPLFGFQRVPFIARVKEYGSEVDLLGYKKQLFMAVENLDDLFVQQWSQWLSTPISLLKNKWEAILSNSNPLLHTARLYALWKDKEKENYSKPILFYAEWDLRSSEIYHAMDEEFQRICRCYNAHIPTVLEYYECRDELQLRDKLRSIEAFQKIEAPMIKTESGYLPDFSSRYFSEDFPFGLQLIKNLAVENNICVQQIDKVLEWGMNMIK